MGFLGRYRSSDDSEECNHPDQSVYTDENGNQVAYCPSCGMEWK